MAGISCRAGITTAAERRIRAVILVLASLSASCATTPPAPLESLTTFIVEGTTTREQVEARLGPPVGDFAGERIAIWFLRYRLTSGANGSYVSSPATGITRSGYSGCVIIADCSLQLILQFEEAGRVRRRVLR